MNALRRVGRLVQEAEEKAYQKGYNEAMESNLTLQTKARQAAVDVMELLKGYTPIQVEGRSPCVKTIEELTDYVLRLTTAAERKQMETSVK